MSIMERCFMGKPIGPIVRERRVGETREMEQAGIMALVVDYSDADNR
jgi:hypothetical protein